MALIPGGAKWHACNMRTATEEASCPAEEGSLFRFANWDQPIDALSNVNDRDALGQHHAMGFHDHAATPLLMAGTDKGGRGYTHPLERHPLERPHHQSVGPVHEPHGRRTRSAGSLLRRLSGVPDNSDVIEQGFGVLYGNDATETLSKIEEVYGHRRDTRTATPRARARRLRHARMLRLQQLGRPDLRRPQPLFRWARRDTATASTAEACGTAVLRYSSGQTAPMTNFIQIRPLFLRPLHAAGRHLLVGRIQDNRR